MVPVLVEGVGTHWWMMKRHHYHDLPVQDQCRKGSNYMTHIHEIRNHNNARSQKEYDAKWITFQTTSISTPICVQTWKSEIKIRKHVTYFMFCYERLVYNWCFTREAAAVYIPSSPNGFGLFELFNIPDRCPKAKNIFKLSMFYELKNFKVLKEVKYLPEPWYLLIVWCSGCRCTGNSNFVGVIWMKYFTWNRSNKKILRFWIQIL